MTILEDVRFAARVLARRPALVAITTLTLGVGIAANAVMFGIVNQLLLQAPPGIAEPDGVRRVYYDFHREGWKPTQTTTFPVIAALQRNVAAGDVAGYDASAYTLGSGAEAKSIDGQLVTGNFFQVLGVRIPIGRAFTGDEARMPEGEPVVVISDGFWRRELGAKKDVLGRTLQINGRFFTIVGVAPRGFIGVDRGKTDVWLPVSSMASTRFGKEWHSAPRSWWVQGIARVRPGESPTLVANQATTAIRNEIRAWNERLEDTTITIMLGSIIGARHPGGMSAESKVSLWLMGVSIIVLLIACANVANLLIARTLERRREIAVRLALGVGRARLTRMLLVEAALLAVIAAIAALMIAAGASRLVQQLLLPGIVWNEQILDLRILGFTLTASIVCVLLAGTAPSLEGIRTPLSEGLKSSSHQTARGHSGMREGLLIVQASLSIILLIGAGLFVRSLRNVLAKDVGIDFDRTLLVTMNLGRAGFTGPQIEETFRRADERVSAVPGVENVSVVRQSIPVQSAHALSISVPGMDKEPELKFGGPYYMVVPSDYFRTMGTAIARGRGFTDAEDRPSARTVIVNRVVADAYWPEQDPVGKCALLGSDSVCTEVVGVIESAMLFRVVRDDRALLYVPFGHPVFGNAPSVALIVRANRNPKAIIALVRREVQGLSPNMPFVTVEPFIDKVAWQLRPWRLGANMFTIFGGIALVIACVGLYSVMAYGVAQRTREIGVRMALGAQSWDVVRLIAWQSSRAVAIGLALGALIAVLASGWVTEMLYEVSPRDPLVYAAATLTLALAAALASVVPARRSTAIDPALAIRSE